jgi:hypothetical protein
VARRGVRLLAVGERVDARLRDRRVMKEGTDGGPDLALLRFTYAAPDGRERIYSVTTRRWAALEDEPLEALLVDPADPSRAVLVDELAGGVLVDVRGRLLDALERTGPGLDTERAAPPGVAAQGLVFALPAQVIFPWLLTFGGVLWVEELLVEGFDLQAALGAAIVGGLGAAFLWVSGRAARRALRGEAPPGAGSFLATLPRIFPLLWAGGVVLGGATAWSQLPAQAEARLALGGFLCRDVLSEGLPYPQRPAAAAVDACAFVGARCRAAHEGETPAGRAARRACVRAALGR